MNTQDETEENEIEELAKLAEMSLKKHMSTPPPGLVKFSSNQTGISSNDIKMAYEYNEYLKTYKRFNPRIGDNLQKIDYKELEIKIGPNSTVQHEKVSTPKNSSTISNKDLLSSDKKDIKKKMNINSPSFSANIKNDKIAMDAIERLNLSPHKEYGNYIPSDDFIDPKENYNDLNVQFVRKYEPCPDNEIDKFSISKSKQHEYETGTKEVKNEIYEECRRFIYDMVKDTYYNYIIQKILEIGENEHKIGLFEKIKELLYELQQDKFGCRVFQKCLEAFKDPQTSQFIFMFGKIREYINELLINENGNFVIQKCLEIYDHQYMKFLLDEIKKDLKALCCHKYGCLVIQKLLDIYIERENIFTAEINEIILNIIADSYDMSKKEYSNYVIQHILEVGVKEHKDNLLINFIKPKFIELSCDQFASNVTEKAIIFSNSTFRKKIWNNLKKLKEKESTLKMLNDKYGNYVMQRIFEYSEHDTRKEIYKMVYDYGSHLTQEGQFVLKFMQKFY